MANRLQAWRCSLVHHLTSQSVRWSKVKHLHLQLVLRMPRALRGSTTEEAAGGVARACRRRCRLAICRGVVKRATESLRSESSLPSSQNSLTLAPSSRRLAAAAGEVARSRGDFNSCRPGRKSHQQRARDAAEASPALRTRVRSPQRLRRFSHVGSSFCAKSWAHSVDNYSRSARRTEKVDFNCIKALHKGGPLHRCATATERRAPLVLSASPVLTLEPLSNPSPAVLRPELWSSRFLSTLSETSITNASSRFARACAERSAHTDCCEGKPPMSGHLDGQGHIMGLLPQPRR